MKQCSHPGCEESVKTDLWNNIKNHDKGWFFQKDGTAYCPDHLPEWVPEWRARQAKLKLINEGKIDD